MPDKGERRPLLNHQRSKNVLHSANHAGKDIEDVDDSKISAANERSVELDTVPEAATVGRNLTWTSAYLMCISRMVGSGIFATPGNIYRSVGSVGLALLVWIAGAGLAACGLVQSLELGCMLPRSGGQKVYLEFMYRRPRFLASTMVAIQAVLLGFTASNCIVFGEYILAAFKLDPTPFAQRTLAVGLLTVITVIHGCFLRTGIWIQNALAWVKIALMATMAVIGIVALFLSGVSEGHKFEAPHWSKPFAGSIWSWDVFATSVFKVMYSFAGYDNVNNVLNEVKNPVWVLKTSSPAALVTVLFFYLMLNVAYFAVVPLKEFRSSGELIAALFFNKVFGEGIASTIFPILVAISAAGNVMVTVFAMARVDQEIARQGFLPFAKYLSSSWPFNAPLGGLIVHYIPSVLVITLPPQKDVYSLILDVEGYAGQIFALAMGIGFVKLRRQYPDLRRPFKAWEPVVWLKIAISVALLVTPFIPPKHSYKGIWYGTYAVVGGGLIICGILYWYIWTRLLPRWRGYRLEEETAVLDDGTTIKKLVKRKRE